MAALVAQYPTLDIELATDMRAISLERREADIAVRFGRPKDGDVIAKRLATVGFGFYATGEWRQRVGTGSRRFLWGLTRPTRICRNRFGWPGISSGSARLSGPTANSPRRRPAPVLGLRCFNTSSAGRTVILFCAVSAKKRSRPLLSCDGPSDIIRFGFSQNTPPECGCTQAVSCALGGSPMISPP